MLNSGLLYFGVRNTHITLKNKMIDFHQFIDKVVEDGYDLNVFEERIKDCEINYVSLLDIMDNEIDPIIMSDKSAEKYLTKARDLYVSIGTLKSDIMGYKASYNLSINVPTSSGNKSLDDLKVGDKLFDLNGKEATVRGIYK